ncbi:MAG: ubiquinol-cytochrome c reductase iron-sulfur subunit [Betaproteobacteria bacterium]|nr:ubiquinol-cytochrome c reductase iron-sulfur subunit [Rhodocyclaceae bacterium]MCG3186795.1 Ubiquinol-cytochrome c reductase iron-sulfur subunit [Rhodocyclaceae bacterium]
MSEQQVDRGRRNILVWTSAVGAVGGVATLVPFVASMSPSERAKAAGAPVEVDISKLEPGGRVIVEWRGKPVWVIRRTPEMLASLASVEAELADPKSERKPDEFTPAYARNQYRSIKPEVLVVVGICTHLGCSPTEKFRSGGESGLGDAWRGGFLCPCHGSTFDLAGRVFKNKPAPDNLPVPPHMYLSDTRLLIGEDKKGA